MNVILSVDDIKHHGSIPLDIDYEISHVEFDINSITVQSNNTYESSNWLTFVPAINSSNAPSGLTLHPSTANIPIPLRSYPSLPKLVNQSGKATWEGATPNLSTAAEWTYGLSYAHTHAAQDEIEITAQFNINQVGSPNFLEDTIDMVSPLAQYIEVADELWNMLAFYTGDTSVSATNAANACATFAQLITSIADTWSNYWSTPVSSTQALKLTTSPLSQEYNFSARFAYDDGGDNIESYTLISKQSHPGPSNEWPSVVYISPTGTSTDLIQGSVQGQECTYTVRAGTTLPAEAWAEITLSWADLNLASVQNAKSSLSVKRNTLLLGEGMPNTNAAFEFSSSTVEAPNIIHPFNQYSQPLILSGTSLNNAIDNALTSLFGSDKDGRTVTIGMFYGYALVKGIDELTTYLPVGLYPNHTISSSTGSTIETALNNWNSSNLPSSTNAEWSLSLVLYSDLTSNIVPLLELNKLVYIIPNE